MKEYAQDERIRKKKRNNVAIFQAVRLSVKPGRKFEWQDRQ